MLLIDDNQPELVELHAFLDDRVGADHKVNLPVRHTFQDRGPLRGHHVAGQQGETEPRGLEVALEGLEVLGGEDFRRRHHGTLRAALDGVEDRARGDDSLAGADVALQEPVHRPWFLHVPLDLLQHALLGVRQDKRQGLDEPVPHLAGGDMGGADEKLLRVDLPRDEHELDAKELLEHQPVPRGPRLLERVRKVDA